MSVFRGAVLGAVLLALAVLVVLQTPALRAGAASRVDRVRGYEVGSGIDPSFALSGGDELIRLVTNALPTTDPGPNDVYYGLAAEVTRPGAQPERRELHLKSHRTGPRTGGPDPVFDSEGTPLADSRHIDLVLDPAAAPGTTVRVTMLGETPSILRAWSWRPRDGAERARRFLALDTDLRRRLAAPLGILAWDHLTDSERSRWIDGHFARLAAVGSAGREHTPHDFFVMPVRVEEEDVLVARPMQSPLTWLVQGPAHVSLEATSTAETAPAQLTLSRVSADTEALGAWDVGPGAAPASWTGDLPAGLQTLVLRPSAPTSLALDVRIPGAARVPPTSDTEAPTDATTIVLRASALEPGNHAVFDARLPRDPAVRSVELEVWGRGTPQADLTISTLAGGRTTVDDTRVVLPENGYDVEVDAYGNERPLWGPSRVKVLLPAGAQELTVASEQRVLVRFRVPYVVDEADPGPPATTRTIGAETTPASRSWARALAPAEEVIVRVKGRVEAVPPPPTPPATWLPTSLDPLGLAQRFEALERLEGEPIGRVLTEITGARPLRVRASQGQARARLSFEVVAADALGASLPYAIDGVATGTVRAALSRGTVRLPALPAGDHSISVGMIPGIRLFANLPPAPGESASVWRARTVWRFDAPVTLTVRTDARGPRGINVIVYDPSPAARTDWSLTATVDRGNPRRRTHGVYTRSTPVRRVYTLPPSPRTDPASLVDGDRARIGLARPLLVPLGDDLEPGLHTVVLSPSQPVYARFFAVVPPGLQDNRALWPESLDE